MKRALTILLAVALVLAIAGCGNGGADPSPPPQSPGAPVTSPDGGGAPAEPIKIGMLAAMTGDRALQGEFAKNSIEIALEEINDAGGILGRPVEVVIEDDLGTDAGAVNAYNRLASQDDIVAIIGSNYSTLSLAYDADVRKAEILTTAQGSNTRLGQLGNPWHYQLRVSDEIQVTASVQYMVDNLGLTKWAVINDTETASSGQAETAVAALKSYGIEPEEWVTYTGGTQDFTAQLTRIRQADVQAVYAAGVNPEIALLTVQYREMGLTAEIMGSNGFSSTQMRETAGYDVSSGIYSATHYVPDTPFEKGRALAEKYLERYGVAQDAAGALAYDHVYMICEAITRAGSTDRTEVRDAFLTIKDYEGAVTIYKVRNDGCSGTSSLILRNDGEDTELLDVVTVEF
ncbi:MAG: ABC transporter substrate-binding protein [Christensenellales bacterium]|jgi:branched-chain amino acid transport system substrate-binding protein